jgi:prepilin-type N-terminal cleavage/methylation domain-containing protein
MKTTQKRGFSLLELMVSLAILSIVMGIIVEGITTMQARNAVETNKLDLTQETREFMDQIVNDIDQAGFPGLNMFDPTTLNPATPGNPICTQNNNLACGLISVSATAIQFEGDVDGTGVSEVYIQLNQPAGGCPCTIQRGTVLKSVGGLPPFYTQVDNVMNTTIFTAYKSDGSLALLPANQALGNLGNITAIGITLYVKSLQMDPKTGQYPTVTMVSTAKINNIQSL